MLFSSVNHIGVLLLFIYLGLVSGLVFFFANFLVNKLKDFLLRTKEKKVALEESKTKEENDTLQKDETQKNNEIKEETKTQEKDKKQEGKQKRKINLVKEKTKKIKIKNNKIILFLSKIWKRKSNEQKLKRKPKTHKNYVVIFFKKIGAKVKKVKKFLVQALCSFIKITILFSVIFISFFINLQLNFGYITMGFLIVFITFFFIAKRLLILVANYLLNFYNYIRKIKRRGKEF